MAAVVAASANAPNRWLLTATIMIGTLAAVMGASTINVALPDIMSGLGMSLDQVSWVSTSYMLANVIAMPSAAWLGQLLSKRILFGLGLAMFLVGSMLCGAAWDFGSMIAFRVFQGLGAGLIIPTAQALLFESYPPEQRGTAMGIYGLGAIMGPAIGPTVGGYLVNLFNWRAIFYVNAPFAISSIAMLGFLPRAARRTDLPFDAPGFVAMVLFLTTLQIALANGAKDGWGATYILVCFGVAAVSLVTLIARELTTPHPLLDLGVFRFWNYNAATIVSLILGLGLYGSTFLIPIYMGEVLNFDALQIGLIMLPGSLVMGVMMLLAGRWSDKVDSRVLIFVGLSIFGYFLYLESLANVNSAMSFYAWALVWRGVGMGLVFSPLAAMALAGVSSDKLSQASGLFNLTRQLAGTVGIAVLDTLLTSRLVFHAARLGENVSLRSGTTQRFVTEAARRFVAQGYTPTNAHLAAMALLAGALRQRATVLAFSDLFLICLAISLTGLAPTLLFRSRVKR